MSREKDERGFVRHTVEVPLEISTVEAAAARTASRGINVSHGGLAFLLDECIDIDRVVHLRIPTVRPAFEADARVVWCRPESGRYLVGVCFLDATHAFQSRMVEQVCAIEQYRAEIRAREGRILTTQEAAAEWIEKYARRFPE